MRSFFIALLFISIMTDTKANDSITVLHHLVRNPKIESADKPVIILLHGVGSNEQDLFSFADQLPDKYLVISARAPITLQQGSYAWYHVDFSTGKPVYNMEQEEKSRNIIIEFIQQVKEKYAVENNPVYLCGFSQGAIMSFSIALTRPDIVQGIAVMSGRLLEEIKPFIASKEKLQSLKIFISHGTNDSTLPVHYAREALTYLKTLGIDPVYKEYREGHGINREMLNDLVNWLQ
jgi:phospholipase/carboxylesterase